MNRHLALTFAGATAVLVTAATGAVAANVGILGSGSPKSVGNLSASSVVDLSKTTVAPGAPVNVTAEPGDSSGSAESAENSATVSLRDGAAPSEKSSRSSSASEASRGNAPPGTSPAEEVTPTTEEPAPIPTVTTQPGEDDDEYTDGTYNDDYDDYEDIEDIDDYEVGDDD
jgi:hypothetical protein